MSDQDRQMFDAALSEAPIEVVETSTPETVQEDLGNQPRDEHGRFAPKATDAQPAAEQPPAVQPAPQPAKTEEAATIPAWRLSEVTQERNELRQRLAALEAKINTKPAEPEKPAPEIWEDPNGFVQAALTPIQQQMQSALLSLSKETAIVRHTEEVVTAAEQAFMEAARNRTLDPADFNRVLNAPNRYSAAVEWHKRNSTLQKVGSDPDAWFEQELSRRMADPAFKAKLTTPPAAAVQPSNVVELPPSLSRIGTAPGPESVGGMDSGSMFRAALS